MTKRDKLVEKLLLIPKGLTWDELTTILSYLGYKEAKKGKTGGFQRKFIDQNNNVIGFLHKPHPGNIVKEYAIKQVIEYLKEKGQIKNE